MGSEKVKTVEAEAAERSRRRMQFEAGYRRRVAKMEVAPVAARGAELDAVSVLASSLGLGGGSEEALARGPLSALGMEDGEVTERGMARVSSAVKFLGELLGGKRHRAAMKAAGLQWSQVNAYINASPEFEEMYNKARCGMKRAMGSDVLDTAYELATEGAEVRDRDGAVVGKKKSEKMLDRLLVMSGDEFRKDGGVFRPGANAAGGGGMTLNFHFGGKRGGGVSVEATSAAEPAAVGEVVDVAAEP